MHTFMWTGSTACLSALRFVWPAPANFRRNFTKVCKLAPSFSSTSRYTAAGFYYDPRPTRWLGLTVATCFVLASLFLCAFWFRGAHSSDGDRAAPSLLLWRMVYIACFLYTSIQILSLIAEFFAGICLLNFREAVALFGYVCVLTTSAAMIFRRERKFRGWSAHWRVSSD